MAVYNWTTDLADGDIFGANRASFIVGVDQLYFDDPGFSAADILFDSNGSNAIFSFGGKTVILDVAPYALVGGTSSDPSLTTIRFADGSLFIIGDNTTSTANDDAPNTIIGSSGDDFLVGAGGADSIFGDAGDDVFGIVGAAGSGLYGNDTLDGGAGTADRIVFFDASAPVTISLNPATGSVAGGDGSPGSTISLLNIEQAIGTGFNDSITGSNTANYIDGGAGNDTISGGGGSDTGNDTLIGGAGDDRLTQTLFSDSIVGGDGTDILTFHGSTTSASGVTVNLSAGTSAASGSTATISGIEHVFGTAFSDTFIGGDPLHAPDQENGVNEIFRPSGGNDTVIGATGNGWITTVDYSNVSASPVTVTLGNSDNLGTATGAEIGTDWLENVDRVRGGAGDDTLVGGSYANTASGNFDEHFRGNAGNDWIDGDGSDTTLGAIGDNDTAEYQNSPYGVVVNLGTTSLIGNFYAGGGTDTVAGGTALDGWDSLGGGTDTLIGIDVVRGSAFDDTIVGGGPVTNTNERLVGNGGNDSLVGVNGNDEADYSTDLDNPAPVYVNLGTGIAFDGLGGTDTLVNLFWARGGDSDDTLIGSNGSTERLMGGRGNDLIDGGATNGVSYAGYQIAVTGVNAFIANGSGTASDGQGGTDTLVNINGLWGGNFDDTLTGGLGDQWFRGRGGDDTIDGGDGIDTVTYKDPNPAGVTVNLITGTATDGWGGPWALQGTDALFNIENVDGSDFTDHITGNSGANRLDGGDGNDTLKGMAGADTLVGGAGIDTIDYSNSTARVIVNMFGTSQVFVGTDIVNPNSVLDGFGATDSISGIENAIGSAFNDFFQGNSSTANRFEGGAGNDTFVGGGSGETVAGAHLNDTLLGGAGDDVLRQTRGNEYLDGGDGFDRIEFTALNITYGGAIGVSVNLAAGTSNADPGNGDTVNGAGGDIAFVTSIEQVNGTSGNDVFVGGDPLHAPGVESGQTEFFRPFGGNDTITGAAGNGRSAAVDYGSNNSSQAVTVTLGNSNNIGTASDGFGGTDTLYDVEQVRGGAGADLLTGGSYGRGITGTFIESFRGNQGNDTINGQGSDTVIGAYGANDRAEYNNSPFAVVVNLGTAALTGTPYGTVNGGTARDGWDSLGGGTDTLLNIDRVAGSPFNDTLVGGNPANNNEERFEGRGGNDYINGGAGNDEADYSAVNAPASVYVDLGAGTAQDGEGGTDTLVSIEFARGGDGNDTLIGGANAFERLTGGIGNDWIDGGDPTGVNYAGYQIASSGVNATIANGSGTASDGQGGTDTLVNINGLIGSNFADTLTGGAGNQWFRGSGGSDTIDGGADTDTVSYRGDPNGVTVNLGTNSATDGWGSIWAMQGTDTLVNIENVEGSSFNDTLTGDANANNIDGGGGNDLLDGSAGIDTLDYSDSPTRVIFNMFGTNSVTVGADTVLAGTALDGFGTTDTISGFENVTGSAFNDYLQGTTDVANVLMGGAGNDTLIGSGNSESLAGGAMDDTLAGGAGDDILRQTRGHDYIDGGAGTNDRLEFTSSGISYGSASSVSVNLAAGTSDADYGDGDTVNGAGGDIAIVTGIEQVYGTAGNDVFVGGDPLHAPGVESGPTELFRPFGGNDTITGAAGNGWNTAVDYSNVSGSAVTVTLGNGNNVGTASGAAIGSDLLFDVDQVRGGSGDDLLVGGSYNQGISGTFTEAFRGNAGNDTIDGQGSDTVLGAYGANDRAEYFGTPFAVVVNLGTDDLVGNFYGSVITVAGGTARDGFSSTGGGTDTLLNIDRVAGSSFNDTLVGGNPAHDNEERFEGRAGNDLIIGGSGNDEADYSAVNAPAAVYVNLGTGTASDGEGGTDTLISVEFARGGDGNDTLIGGANAFERLTGGIGNDWVDGGATNGVNYAGYGFASTGVNATIANGAGEAADGQGGTDTLVNINGLWGSSFDDTLTGGAGDQWFRGNGGSDTMDGGADSDTVSYRGDPNGVTVNLATNSATDGWGGIWNLQGTDTLLNIENVEGSDFADNITGDANANRLDGGAGNDTLTGGAGNDAFVYSADPVAGNADRVTDFESGADQLLLDATALAWNAQNGALDSAAFASGSFSEAQDATNRIIYNTSTGEVFFDADGTGVSAAAVGLFTLDSAPALAASDIVVFNAITPYLWSELTDGQSLPFNPNGNSLVFDDPGISAGDIRIPNAEPAFTQFSHGGKTVTLLVDPFALTTGNVSFANGSLIIIGDNTTGTVNDHAANTIAGGGGDDFLVGAGGADSVGGGGGDDVLGVVPDSGTNLYGNDTFDGGSGSDTLFYLGANAGASVDLVNNTATGGDDSISGSTLTLIGVENVSGTSFSDTITGNSGANFISGAAGSDSLTGGAGLDTLDYGDSPYRVIVNMFGTSSVTVGADTVLASSARDGWDSLGGGTDTISGFENVIGSAFDDYIQGGSNIANRLEGGAGDDFLAGSGGQDTLAGVTLDDTVLGGAGDDVLRQTRGHDFLDGGAGADRLEFSGNGINYGGAIGVTVNLNAGTSDADPNNGDSINGAGGDVATVTGIEKVYGTAGNDIFTANSLTQVNGLSTDLSQRFRGGAGSDTINGATGNGRSTYLEYNDSGAATGVKVNLGPTSVVIGADTVIGGSARDSFGGIDRFTHIDGVVGSNFGDTLIGGGDSPGVSGTGSREFFEGRAGNDWIDGRGGGDRTDYTSSPFGVVVNLDSNPLVGNFYGNGVITVNGGSARDGYDSVGGGTDTLISVERVRGSEFNDILIGGSGDQQFEGLGGDDTINGDSPAMFSSGGGDHDVVLYSRSTEAVYVNLGDGIGRGLADSVTGGTVGIDTLLNIEEVRGSDFADSLVGAAGDGDDNEETFTGQAGNDTLDGGAINGPWDFNIAAYILSPNGVIANLSNATVGGVAPNTARDGYDVNGNPAGIDTLININAVDGSSFNDTLVGNDGDNAFQGRAGNDSIVGGAGTDFVTYVESPNRIVVNLSGNSVATPFGTVAAGAARDGWDTLGGGTDALSGFEIVEGSNFNDTLIGGIGNEFFDGRTGNDSLVGGAGNDTVYYDHGVQTRVIVNLSDVAITVSGLSVAAGTARDGFDTTGGGTDAVSGMENVVGSFLGDFILGNSAANLLEGLEGSDTLVGGTGAAASTVPGAGGDFANDTLLGGDDGDYLRHTRGNDWLDGGNGIDYLTFVSTSATSNNGVTYGGATGVNVNLATGVVDHNTSDSIPGGGANNPVLISIEGVIGTTGNDVLTGGSFARSSSGGFLESYRPGGGNDTVNGDNRLLGTAATLDRVEYSEAPAAVIVNFGPNAIVSGTTTVAGGTARDGFGGTDLLFDIDWAVGTSFADTLVGGSVKHNDGERFEGRGGNDYINGGAGTDQATYQSSPGAVNVNLGTGVAFDGHGGVDTLVSIEQVRGSIYNDVLTGGNASEFLTGDRGNDTIDGGAGTDIVSYGIHSRDTGGIYVNFSGSSASPVTLSVWNGFDFETDWLFNIEGVAGTNSGDTLIGGAGNQQFQGSGGSDLIDGGLNTDTARYSGDPTGVIVNLSNSEAVAGSETVQGGTARDGYGRQWINFVNEDAFNAEVGVEGSIPFTRVADAGNPLVGSWYSYDLEGPDGAIAITFLSDGSYFLAQDGDADANPGGQDGMERGTYTGNGSGAFTSTTTVDTNGEWGLSDSAITSATVAGDTLTIETVSDGAFVFYRAVDADNPLAGGWHFHNDNDDEDVEDAILTILGDGTLLVALDGNPSMDPFFQDGQDGMERGTYTFDAATGAVTTPVTVDTNGEWGIWPLQNIDTLISIENVLGSRYADTLVGGAGANRLEGNDGDDEFWVRGDDGGPSGNDTLDGGAGTDLISYQSVIGSSRMVANFDTAPYVVGGDTVAGGTLRGGDGPLGSSSTLTLINVEDVYGTPFDDIFVARAAPPAGSLSTDNLAFHFQGAEGDDTIVSAGSNDTMVSSSFYGRTTFADYTESPGPVIVNLGPTSIVVGADTVAGNTARDGWGYTDRFVLTNSGDIDGAIGSMNDDTLVGGGQGRLGSGQLLERFEGLGGNDYIDGGNVNDGYADLVEYTFSPSGVDVNLGTGIALDGWGGTDTLVDIRWVRGSQFADVLTGSDFDQEEAFEGLGGNDTIDGGAEFDNVFYYLAREAVYVNLGLGIGRGLENAQSGGLVPSAVGIDTLIGIEAAHGSDFNDSLVGGGPGAQPPPGMSLADIPAWEMNLFLGSEEFEGFSGNDTLNGGDTNPATLDIAVYRNAPSAVIFNLSAAAVTSGGITVGTNQVSDGQGVGSTPMGFDTLVNINGVEGSNFNDTLVGGAGNDYFLGGQGNDSIVGGAGVDTLSYETSNFAFVNLSAGTGDDDTLVGGTDTLSGIEKVVGSSGADVIMGDAAANLLAGDEGNDFLSGGDSTVTGANDTLYGGDGDDQLIQTRGADRIDGGDGFDRLSYSIGGTFAVNANLALGTVNAGGNIAIVTSIETVDGTAGNDTLTGGDRLHAPGVEGGINETFRPFGGNDTVTGAAGPGWFTTVDYGSNSSASPVTIMLGNGNNLGFATDGLGGTDLLINVDQAIGGSGNDLLTGGSYATSVNGSFFEAFRGGRGDDTIDGGGSDSTLGPATSTDRAGYSNSTFAVVVNLGGADLIGNFYGAGTITVAGGTARDGFSSTGGGTDTLIDIDYIQGSNFNDTLLGGNLVSEDSERFEGRGGNDSIDGGAGNDEADYSSQLDAVVVNLGASTLAIGSETLAGGTAYDGQDGLDTLVNIEWARGGDFDDTLVGGNANIVRLTGGIGDDYLDGGTGSGIHYTAYFLAADSAIVNLAAGGVVVGDQTVNGGTAIDGQGGTDTLVNINGAWGSNFNDTLLGGEGSQYFRGQARNDYIDGGDGEDFVTYRGDPNGVIVNLGTATLIAGTDTVLGGTARDGWGGIWNMQGIDTLVSIENVEGSRNADTLVGAGTGGSLNGRGGNDSIVGGAGRDEVIYRDANEGVNVNLQTGSATDGQGGTDTLAGIEDVRGSDFDDTLTGSDSADVVEVFDGSMGDDTIDGGGGTDFASWEFMGTGSGGISAFIDGGAGTVTSAIMGTDTLVNIEGLIGSATGDLLTGAGGDQVFRGMAGADVLAGGANGPNGDTADYSRDPGGVIVNLSAGAAGAAAAGTALDGWGDTDMLSGIENVEGSDFDDTIVGSGGDNELHGGAGDDSLIGGAGGDRIEGGAGTDTAYYGFAAGSVVVNLVTGTAQDGLGGNDTLSGVENVIGSDSGDVLTGDGGNNFLSGLASNDTLIGGLGKDTLDGGEGVDNMTGGAGNDVYLVDGSDEAPLIVEDSTAGGGIDTIITTVGMTLPDNIEIVHYVGPEGGEIFGNAGNNVIITVANNDSMDGAEGTDTISYVLEETAVTVNLAFDFAVGAGGNDFLPNFENAIGGEGNDSIVGDDESNILDGSGGVDTLAGGDGGDTYYVDDPNDFVVEAETPLGFRPHTEGEPPVGFAGFGDIADTIIAAINFSIESLGGIENLTLSGPSAFAARGNAQANTITGNELGNTLTGGAGADTLNGGTGSDTASYTDSAAKVVVNLGATAISGNFYGAGVITVNGGTARDGIDDTVSGGSGILGAAGGGTDTLVSIENIIGSGFNDTIMGGAGADGLDGGEGADSLAGGAGNDALTGGAGNDTLDGGAGTDTLDFSGASEAVVVNLGAASITAPGFGAVAAGTARGEGTDRVLNLEVVIGGAGNDTLVGGAANETLIGSAGNDSLAGGTGNDAYVDVATGDRLNDAGGIDTVFTAESHTLGAAFEFLILTGTDNLNGTGNAAANLLAGNSGDNRLDGGAANDTLAGGAGHDRLDGGLGVDSMLGGAGDDTYFVDSAGEAVVEAVDAGTDTVMTTIAYTAGANVENVTLIGAAVANLTGNALHNILTGNGAVNVLNGLADDDVLIGGGGNDVFLIGAGSHHGAGEFIDGGTGTDVIRFTSTVANDTLTLSTGIAAIEAVAISDSVGGAAGLVALNVDASQVEGALTITGNAGANVLTGGFGNDSIVGGAGIDQLTGGAGNDTLNGGLGADTSDGGDGNDFLYADATEFNNEALIGGDGTDIIVYTGTTATPVGNPLTLTGLNLSSIEGILLTGAAAIHIDASAETNGVFLGGNTAGNKLTGTNNDVLSDTIAGGGGTDTLVGEAGDDLFLIAAVADYTATEVIDGGDGIDTLRYTGAAGTLTLTNGVDNIERVEITGAATVLNASAVQNALTITGGAGNDLITGTNVTTGSGDTIDGGAGNDTLIGGSGTDSLAGGAGNDVFLIATQGQLTEDVLDGGADSDTIRYTGTGTLTVTSATNIEAVELSPTTGATAINIDASAVTTPLALTGNAGNNLLTGGSGANLLTGNAGNDTFYGGAGNDTLNGGAGNDTMYGGGDDDLFLLGALTDMTVAEFLYGEAGYDTLRYTGAAASLVLGTGAMANLIGLEAVQITDAAGAITGTLAINVNASAMTSAFAITGNNGANRFDGTDNNDTLIGNGGADTLVGGFGDDYLSGGDGNDLFIIPDSDHHFADETIAGGSGTDTVRLANSNGSNDLTLSAHVTDIEVVLLTDSVGGAAGTQAHNVNASQVTSALTIIGNAGDNMITGGSGNDSLNGGAGTDTLAGGGGNDTLNGMVAGGNDWLDGGLGDDLYQIDSINDVVQDTGGGTDTVQLTLAAAASYTLTANVENITLLGAVGSVTGNDSANVITGNAGANTLDGGEGADTIIGGGGADTLNGGSDLGGPYNDVFLISAVADMPTAERIDGGAGTGDILIYTGTAAATLAITANVLSNVEEVRIATAAGATTGTAAINVNAAAVTSNGMTLTGNDGANIFTGTGLNDTLTGNGGNDSLAGGIGDDVLSGGEGADTLIGGAGVDTLTGGAGNDLLIWDSLDGSIDGGDGTDVLAVNGLGQNINLNGLAGDLITDVEIINLTGTGNNDLTLTLADVLAISYSTDTLRIDGNAGDVVSAGAGWEQGANVVIGANTYATYTQGPAILQVDLDIDRTGITL